MRRKCEIFFFPNSKCISIYLVSPSISSEALFLSFFMVEKNELHNGERERKMWLMLGNVHRGPEWATSTYSNVFWPDIFTRETLQFSLFYYTISYCISVSIQVVTQKTRSVGALCELQFDVGLAHWQLSELSILARKWMSNGVVILRARVIYVYFDACYHRPTGPPSIIRPKMKISMFFCFSQYFYFLSSIDSVAFFALYFGCCCSTPLFLCFPLHFFFLH